MERLTTPLRHLYNRRPGLVIALLVAILGFAIYWRVVGFIHYSDDVPYLLTIVDLNWWEPWIKPTKIVQYRPLQLMPIFLSVGLFGLKSAWFSHTIVLAIHILNGWLLGLVTRRLIPDRPVMHILPPLLYICFPFTYQAVALIAALGPVLGTTGLILIVLMMLRWTEDATLLNLIGVGLAALLATFSHEMGITGIGLILVVFWLANFDGDLRGFITHWRRVLPPLLVTIPINAAYFLLLRQFYPNRSMGLLSLWDNARYTLSYFVQAAAYPSTIFAGDAMRRFSLDPLVAVYVFSIPLLVILFTGVWRSEQRLAGLLGLLWYAGSAVVPAFFVDWPYINTSPRIFMMGSPGLMLAWVVAFDGWWHISIGRLTDREQAGVFVMRGLVTLLTAWMLIYPSVWVTRSMGLIAILDEAHDEAFAAVEEHGKAAAIVNLPSWIGPWFSDYPLGVEGTVLWPNFVAWYQIVWANIGTEVDEPTYFWPDKAPNLEAHNIRLGFHSSHTTLTTPEVRTQAMQNREVILSYTSIHNMLMIERAEANPDMPSDALRFSNGLIAGMGAELQQAGSGDVAVLHLDLQSEPGPLSDVFFVHLLCGEEIINQADGSFMRGLYPFEAWRPGESWSEVRLIEVPPGTDRDCLALRVGMYNPMSGEQVPLDDGRPFIVLPLIED